MEALRRFDLRRLPESGWLAGIDEAGRGALAGPVVAAAVFVQRGWMHGRGFQERWEWVNDSKQLSATRREQLCRRMEQEVMDGALHASPGTASVLEIERDNILGATLLAMRRAIETACPTSWNLPTSDPGELFGADASKEPAGCILIDGKPLRKFPYRHEGIVKGDGKSLAIALASILAKVTRDRLMEDLDELYPQYGFRVHKGYGTAAHRAAILEHGPCPVHRPKFLRKLFAEEPEESKTQGEMFARA